MINVEELKALHEKATKGEWVENDGYSIGLKGHSYGYPSDGKTVAGLDDGEYIQNINAISDGKFICYLKNNCTEIIEALEFMKNRREG